MTARPYRRRGRSVQARFLVRELPGITVSADDDGVRDAEGRDTLAQAARRAAERTLAEAGRGYLGGRLELRTHGGGVRGRRALHDAAGRAATLAVTATLRGDDTGVSVRATRRPR
ncbi:hypothetical protein E6R18_29655 [Streptomyces sp. A1277]|uniref:hypothetical protein n=1 Tax=Streptomyces sp. A1277 TaxID=2563103 RepID=UPI0010A2777E|nr:hypothetical protein [Streptomyces sp. A1277]THA28013.1 hypothetical protein E6R18_29655 [Streptomyces sp. A1277]